MSIQSTKNLILKRYRDRDYEKIITRLIDDKRLDSSSKALYIYSEAILKNRLEHLKSVFPKSTNHAVAIKANSHPKVLAEIIKNDCGLEAASFEEVMLAVDAGCVHEKIVFDSPVKTTDEIDYCNNNIAGMILNANCFQELDRLKGRNNIRVGIRINPLVDIGSPGIYNVSVSNSKFGIPITDKDRIIEYALRMPNVDGLHIHAGSEIGSQENHISAIASIVEIAEEIRSQGKKLKFIDIGGGIPANMKAGEQKGLDSFVYSLNEKCPVLFRDYQLITEYGRFVQAHAACTVSKVEYILDHSEPNIALIHVGADLFPREIYSSSPPHHEIFVLDQKGRLKNKQFQSYDIGGPLCFSGDFIKRNISLPHIEPDDYICIADTGANTLSMWSRHCGREEVELILI